MHVCCIKDKSIAYLKTQTIPRLELLGALLLARLITSVRDSLRDLVSEVIMLYRFFNSSILDKGPYKAVETICTEQSAGDSGTSYLQLLEPLSRRE